MSVERQEEVGGGIQIRSGKRETDDAALFTPEGERAGGRYTRDFRKEVLLMPLARCPDVEGKQYPEPAHHVAIEIVCIRLAERVRHALRRTGYSALTRIDVLVRPGAVVLKGRVISYHMKQLAQETARQV